ncbi:MAG: DUF6933 domain-containing protein [Gemmatimonadaceae bacterium]
MVTLRCTKKLLRRMKRSAPTAAAPATTALGDWYATLLFVRPRHLVLCVSERSRLAVLLEAAPLTTLAARFVPALREVLEALGVSDAAISREEQEMVPWFLGPTQSRSVLGTLNEYVKTLEYEREAMSLPGTASIPDAAAILEQSLFLSQIICSPLQWRHPGEVARDLLEAE